MYDAVTQLSSFKKCKSSLLQHQAVVIVDFSENYVARQFAEAQSAYYSRNSVTIHPMVMLFSQDSSIARDSVVGMSNDIKHDAAAVKKFIEVLVSHVSTHYPHISHLILWSDGAGSQYKSKVPLYNITQSFNSSLKITWNFFGSRHGKGESDGESAVVKNFLDRSIKSQQFVIHDAKDAFQFLNSSDGHVPDGKSRRHFYLVLQQDIDAVRKACSSDDVCSIPNVRKIHHVEALDGSVAVQYKRSSCYCLDACVHSEPYKVFKYPG
jgi:hypothetical protein